MRFSPEQLAGLPESTDRRARARRNPSSLTCLEMSEGNGGIVLNVSETGVAIAVAQSIDDDHIACLSFRLPLLDRTFQAQGEVVWRSESKKSAGVRFVNLDERDRVQIRNWIRAEIVGAELQIPQESERTAAEKSPLIVMPSPRRAVQRTETDAERDEQRASEFDRMFPSEASLTAVETPVEPEFNFLAATTDDEDVELAAEAFLATQEMESSDVEAVEATDVIAADVENGETAGREGAAEEDWREQWERFHLERENLVRSRSRETILELPAPFSAPLPDAPVTDLENAPVMNHEDLQALAGKAEFEFPIETPVAVPWSQNNPESTAFAAEPFASGGSARILEREKEKIATRAVSLANEQQNEKNPLSIAALCTVLVVMCFVLGYAIQPGAFRFFAGKFGDTPDASVTGQIASETPTTSTAPTSEANTPAANDAVTSPTVDNTPPAAPRQKPAITAAKTSATEKAVVTQPAQSEATVSPIAAAPATAPARVNPENMQPAPAAIQPPAQKLASPAGETMAASAPAATAAREAATPVSFFPVTAPSVGSPPKLMQLPEETVSEIPGIVIRSHQFLFVPAQPGLESEHELERVHLGDRIVKVDPAYPAQALEKAQGGTVHLRSTIGPDGAVVDVQPISGPTLLIPAAVSAVRQWRYKPTDIDGKAIAIEEDIVIEFRPTREIAAR
jgi:periplasmic protein TonB